MALRYTLETNRASKLLICVIATTFCACAVLLSERNADEERHRQMVYRMDAAHVFVTNSDFPKTKPYHRGQSGSFADLHRADRSRPGQEIGAARGLQTRPEKTAAS